MVMQVLHFGVHLTSLHILGLNAGGGGVFGDLGNAFLFSCSSARIRFHFK